MENYMEKIKAADTLDELDRITEQAANDDRLTGEEYTEIYSAALRKAQDWDPQNRTAFHDEQPTTAAEKIGAALSGLSMLGARVSVYVPATCGTADAADNAREVDAVASTLSAWFGGATIQPGAGCWMSDTCGLVKEQTTVVYAACTAEQLADRIAALRTLCENLKAEMAQEAVAMQIDGIPGASGLYFI